MGIAKDLCDAIDVIVKKRLSELQFDKTIQGMVITCSNIATGEYQIKYQDSTIIAFCSDPLTIYYKPNTQVFISVPWNNLANRKTITGTVSGEVLNSLVSSWVGTGEPTTENYPADNWVGEEREIHINDSYRDQGSANNLLYIFQRAEDYTTAIPKYTWIVVPESQPGAKGDPGNDGVDGVAGTNGTNGSQGNTVYTIYGQFPVGSSPTALPNVTEAQLKVRPAPTLNQTAADWYSIAPFSVQQPTTGTMNVAWVARGVFDSNGGLVSWGTPNLMKFTADSIVANVDITTPKINLGKVSITDSLNVGGYIDSGGFLFGNQDNTSSIQWDRTSNLLSIKGGTITGPTIRTGSTTAPRIELNSIDTGSLDFFEDVSPWMYSHATVGGIAYTAKTHGVNGDSISVTHLGGINKVLGVITVGNDVTIQLGTNSSGVVTSTAASVANAVNMVATIIEAVVVGTAAIATKTMLAGGAEIPNVQRISEFSTQHEETWYSLLLALYDQLDFPDIPVASISMDMPGGGGSTPSLMTLNAGIIELDGEVNVDYGILRSDVYGISAANLDGGSAQCNVTTSWSKVATQVPFNKSGGFPNIPHVTCTPNSTVDTRCAVTNITLSGFDLYAISSASALRNFQWIAYGAPMS